MVFNGLFGKNCLRPESERLSLLLIKIATIITIKRFQKKIYINNRTDVSEGTKVNSTSASKVHTTRIICYHW